MNSSNEMSLYLEQQGFAGALTDSNVEQRPHELMDGKMNGLIDEWRAVEKKTGVINGQRMDVVAFQTQRVPDCQTF